MTPETKGQPEPVVWVTLGWWEEGLGSEVVTFEPTREHAERAGENAAGLGYKRTEARPLYDYDVPALMARQEKLVEALERADRVLYEVHDGRWTSFSISRARDEIHEALAAAREET